MGNSRTWGRRGTQDVTAPLLYHELAHTRSLGNMASGFFVNFTVVGTDATTGFSFSAVSVAWIGPQMNHTVSSVDNKHSGNHKIVVLLYTDRTKPVIEYSKLQNGSYNFFFWWKFSQSALNVTSPFNHSASHKHTAGGHVLFISIATSA